MRALTCVSYSNSELTADMLHKVRMKKISDVPVPVVTSLSSAELRESASLLLHWSTHKINSRGPKHRKTLKPTRTHHAPRMTPSFNRNCCNNTSRSKRTQQSCCRVLFLHSQQSLRNNLKTSDKRGMLLQVQLQHSAEITLSKAVCLSGQPLHVLLS